MPFTTSRFLRQYLVSSIIERTTSQSRGFEGSRKFKARPVPTASAHDEVGQKLGGDAATSAGGRTL
jgi:hypothetical protein